MRSVYKLNGNGRVYRVDRFKVPVAGREEFLARVHETHVLLRTLPGFEGDLLLESEGDAEGSRIVTVALWKDHAAVVEARARVEADRRKTGFDPQQVIARLGVEADMGMYGEIAEALNEGHEAGARRNPDPSAGLRLIR
jgi:heme-degrading monooxygenase HmoA